MRGIKSQVGYTSYEHFVIELTDDPVKIDFVQQVDDILVSTPDGDILVSWDNDQFSRENCLLIKKEDNLKEIGNTRCTHFYMMARNKNEKPLIVYITGQRN